jgi:hypothetical protein
MCTKSVIPDAVVFQKNGEVETFCQTEYEIATINICKRVNPAIFQKLNFTFYGFTYSYFCLWFIETR